MKVFLRFIVFISLFFFFSCKDEIPKQTFLALGDSYTIGESVGQNERWPEQLTLELAEKSIALAPPTIIAKTGWTTDELQEGINQAPLDYPYDWVSLLIGVNNQYRGLDIETFKEEIENLLSQAIIFSGNKNAHVFVISIPDWGVMPFAKSQNQEKIATEIDDFNQAIYEICIHNNIRFVDITPISRQVSNHPEWIATDGLHPSGEQYAQWVKELLPIFLTQ
jgi:lysophospholipase L1-like esterase